MCTVSGEFTHIVLGPSQFCTTTVTACSQSIACPRKAELDRKVCAFTTHLTASYGSFCLTLRTSLGACLLQTLSSHRQLVWLSALGTPSPWGMALLDQALVALGNLLKFARGLRHDKGGHIQKGFEQQFNGTTDRAGCQTIVRQMLWH